MDALKLAEAKGLSGSCVCSCMLEDNALRAFGGLMRSLSRREIVLFLAEYVNNTDLIVNMTDFARRIDELIDDCESGHRATNVCFRLTRTFEILDLFDKKQ